MVQVHMGNLDDMGRRFVDAWLRAKRGTAVRETQQRGDVREHTRRLVACDRVVGATNCAALYEGTNASTFNAAPNLNKTQAKSCVDGNAEGGKNRK